jgi:glycosyltransferase involved in cell wall biosynthesis
VRIALVETQAYGGLLHYTVQLGDALAARGHSVDLITPRRNELADYPERARMRDVLTPTVRTPSPRGVDETGLRRTLGRGLVAIRLVRAWTRVVVEAWRGRYDVVILDADLQYPPAAIGAWVLSRLPAGARMASISHNVQAFTRGMDGDLVSINPAVLRVLRGVYGRVDPVFVHGDRIRSEFESLFPDSRIAVIPHGDERLFGEKPPPPSDEENILFFGYWRKVKGLAVLMDAFDVLARRRPEATLTIAGKPFAEDFDMPAIRRWADAHDGRVKLIEDYVPIEDVEALFARARVVTTPYLAGYQSGVVHLAMTMARPVVASDVGDIPSVVIDAETGFLVEPGNVEELAGALERVLGDPVLAASLGASARRRIIEGSSWEKVAERVEAQLTGS